MNERFRGAQRAARHRAATTLFEREPFAILESFLLMMQHHGAAGHDRAHAARAVARARRDRRQLPPRPAQPRCSSCRSCSSRAASRTSSGRMNQYGMLGRYLPEFGRIVGQMQHDLFHVYTVDQHILMVLRNLRRFTMPEHAHEFPFCCAADRPASSGPGCSTSPRCSTTSPRAAAATTRARRGATRAASAATHGLSRRGRRAGRVPGRAPPADVARRAEAGRLRPGGDRARSPSWSADERRLTALYLLTVADMRGTSPKVWNAWKGKLLEDLFRATRRVLTGAAARARRRARGEAGRGDAAAAPLRAVRTASRTALGAARHRLLPAPRRRRRSPGTRATCTTASTPTSRWSRRALAPVRRRPAGDDLHARPAQTCSRASAATSTAPASTSLDAKIHTTRNGYALDTFLVMGQGSGAHYRDLHQP